VENLFSVEKIFKGEKTKDEKIVENFVDAMLCCSVRVYCCGMRERQKRQPQRSYL